ncbi:MAG: hypothetical protein CGW95_09255 [Phenylobacterium zucineum]|nr:MAG: hypothetical protein CGW95_09255 [Phenylobacterium zucineum]
MAINIPAKDLFSEATSAKKAAAAMEEFEGALEKSFSNPGNTPGVAPAPKADPSAVIEGLIANKSMSADVVAALSSALAAQTDAQATLVKDIGLTAPLSSSFAAYDLEAPAKMLTPRQTPLRNKIVRKKGVGTAHRTKVISGFTGTETGGQGNIWAGQAEGATNSFGSLSLQRGPKISYTAYDQTFNYVTYGLSDTVSFDANFSGVGFQDLRQLSATSTLYATMLFEEKAFLYGRTTALAAPTVTLTARAKTASETALPAAAVYVYAAADAGSFGNGVASTVQTVTPTAGQVVDVTISYVAGAIGYNVYAGATTGNANAFLQGRTGSQTYTLQGPLVTTGSTAPTTDSSAPANAFDGIFAQTINGGGQVNNINGAFSTSNPGTEFQTVFANGYAAVKADYDEIVMNGADRKQLSEAIKSAGSQSAYRINLAQDEVGNYVGGAVIGSLVNETTGKQVAVSVNPWMEQGSAAVMSWTLPLPDSQISETWAWVGPQDYLGQSWPVIQQSYDFSTYVRGTLVGYAPTYNGVVTGIKAA